MIILIQALFAGSPIPAGVTKASTSVVVTDSATPPLVQTFSLNGTETPPYSVSATVAPGVGSVVLTDIDSTGAIIGTPVTVKYPAEVLGVSGATVVITTP
jgi:hypothetical protein